MAESSFFDCVQAGARFKLSLSPVQTTLLVPCRISSARCKRLADQVRSGRYYSEAHPACLSTAVMLGLTPENVGRMQWQPFHNPFTRLPE